MIVKIGHMLLIIQPLLLGIWMKFSDKQSLFERLTRHMVLSSFLKKNKKKLKELVNVSIRILVLQDLLFNMVSSLIFFSHLSKYQYFKGGTQTEDW